MTILTEQETANKNTTIETTKIETNRQSHVPFPVSDTVRPFFFSTVAVAVAVVGRHVCCLLLHTNTRIGNNHHNLRTYYKPFRLSATNTIESSTILTDAA